METGPQNSTNEVHESYPSDELEKMAREKLAELFPNAKDALDTSEGVAVIKSFLGDVMAVHDLPGFVFHRFTADRQHEILNKFGDTSKLFEDIPEDLRAHYEEKLGAL